MASAEERKNIGKHVIHIEERGVLTITGVLDVISFDEAAIIADTSKGALVVKGVNLHVSRLNLDSGEMCVDGELGSVSYEKGAGKPKGSMIGRLFK